MDKEYYMKRNEETARHCNNCGSKNVAIRKEVCKYMTENGLCGKTPACTSSGRCQSPCSYYEK